jgi:hypothetical protein
VASLTPLPFSFILMRSKAEKTDVVSDCKCTGAGWLRFGMGWLTSLHILDCICKHYLISKWDLLRSLFSDSLICEISTDYKLVTVAKHYIDCHSNQL